MATIFLNLHTSNVNILFSYTAAHVYMHVQHFLNTLTSNYRFSAKFKWVCLSLSWTDSDRTSKALGNATHQRRLENQSQNKYHPQEYYGLEEFHKLESLMFAQW